MLDNFTNKTEKDIKEFTDFFKPNGPTIYAFITDKVNDAIKIGYTTNHPLRRIDEWKQKYGDKEGEVTCIGYWSAEEVNEIGEHVFFWDHEVHKKVEGKGYKNIKKDEFYDTFLSEKGKAIQNLHFSKEFFRKYKDVIYDDPDGKEREALSKEILEDILIEMKKLINAGDTSIKTYKIGTHKEADVSWGSPQGYDNTELQNDCIKAGVNAIKNNKKNLLMSAVMRFGKTHAAYEIVHQANMKRVIIVSAKADVRNAWREDVNHKHFYKDFVFIEVRKSYTLDVSYYDEKIQKFKTEKSKNVYGDMEKEYEGKTILYFFTLHDLAGSLKELKTKHKGIFDKPFDMMIIDETHYGSHSGTFGQIPGFTKNSDDKDLDDSDYKEFEQEQKEVNAIRNKLNVKYDVLLQVSGTPYYNY